MSRARMALAVLGFGLALAGVLRDDRRLVWGAIAVIGVLVAARMVGRGKPSSR